MATKIKTSFVCQNCGSSSGKWLGRCPECQEWNSFVEETPIVKDNKFKYSPNSTPIKLDDVKGLETERFLTGIKEFDQVLGGGIVKGSVILVGGEPGIGKSTIMLQIAGILADKSRETLYVTGEESPSQIKLRGDRLGVKPNLLNLMATTSFEDLLHAANDKKYDYIIVDSIQTITTNELTSSGGTVGQVRHVTYRLVEFAKSSGTTVFIVGQVTKDGAIAGPKVLEHLVDTVLYFEGDYSRGVRILRSVKNRFGSTDEVGIFEMSAKGLIEASNLSFLESGNSKAAGKVITPVVEGTRPFLLEVQSLVAPTFFQFPKRNAIGFDNNRMTMLIAIIEKKGGINLGGADVYLNVAGGMRINEPAADLAICAAIISSFRDISIPLDIAFIGEVGLTGEVRAVSHLSNRCNEAIRFNVKTIISPQKADEVKSVKFVEVKSIKDLVTFIDKV